MIHLKLNNFTPFETTLPSSAPVRILMDEIMTCIGLDARFSRYFLFTGTEITDMDVPLEAAGFVDGSEFSIAIAPATEDDNAVFTDLCIPLCGVGRKVNNLTIPERVTEHSHDLHWYQTLFATNVHCDLCLKTINPFSIYLKCETCETCDTFDVCMDCRAKAGMTPDVMAAMMEALKLGT